MKRPTRLAVFGHYPCEGWRSLEIFARRGDGLLFEFEFALFGPALGAGWKAICKSSGPEAVRYQFIALTTSAGTPNSFSTMAP